MSSQRPQVVIIGAGFAGMWAAKHLAKAPVDITLIDRNNYHSFFPLLYQVAAAELDPADIAYPIRTIFRRQRNLRFLQAQVEAIDLEGQTVSLGDATVAYDYLVFGPGSTTRYFDVPGAEAHSYPLRTLDEGLRLRNHLLDTFEAAAATESETERERLLTYAIVGGGPTGVEFAGALQELLRGPFRKDFPELAKATPRVVVLEAGERLLPVYPDGLSDYTLRRLTRIGVDVRLGTTVDAVGPDHCVIGDDRLETSTIVWTAGIGGEPVWAEWGLPARPNRTIAVEADLALAGHPEVFVVGDAAFPAGAATPQVAQGAIQHGRHAAGEIRRRLAGQDPEPFRYRELGNMAVIGRNAAVVHLFNKIPFKGFVGWAMWLTIHLAKLVGFRNRLAALVSWSGDYFFGDRAARLRIPGATSG